MLARMVNQGLTTQASGFARNEACTLNNAMMLEKLACPKCGGGLDQAPGQLHCRTCNGIYPAQGVIDLLIDQSSRTALEDIEYDKIAGYNNDAAISQIGNAWLRIFRKAAIVADNKHILEIGAGTGALTIALLRSTRAASIFASDISDQFLRKALERAGQDARLVAVRCDCNQMPVREGQFDIVVGRSILHHLLDYELLLAQCARLLAPGGKAIFFEPMLEGKLVVAMFASLVIDLVKRGNDKAFTKDDIARIEKMVRHITKESWYPQTREALAKLEDKYIFTIPGMTAKGRAAGFSTVDFVTDEKLVDPTFWRNFVHTLKMVGIAPEKLEKYQFISESYGRTFGAFGELARAPMGYFILTR